MFGNLESVASAIRRNRRRRELRSRLQWLQLNYYNFEDQGKSDKALRLIALINNELDRC